MVHVEERVEYFLLVFCIFIHAGINFSLIAGEEQILHLNDLDDVLLLPPLCPAPHWLPLRSVIELKVLELKVQPILDELLHPCHVYLVELGDETGTDEAMLESQSHFLAI